MNSTTKTQPTGAAQGLLRRFLTTQDEVQASLHLERLICEHAEPVIKAVINRKMGVNVDFARRLDRIDGKAGSAPKRSVELDADDLCQTCMTSVTELLFTVRREGDVERILDFRAYVGRLALNAFAQQMRQCYPERHRLRRKLWYVAQGRTPVSGFAWWQDQISGEQLFGFQAWQGRPLKLTSEYRRWQDGPGEFVREALSDSDPRRLSLPDLLARILNWVRTPMEVDDLVTGLMELLGVTEAEIEAMGDEETGNPLERISDEKNLEDEMVNTLDAARRIAALWPEVCALPLRQRRAFLLHLEREEVLVFVKHVGCSLGQIAELLEVTPAEFFEWLARLPMPDRYIGERFGSTDQEVRNLRMSARKRLSRRLKE